MYLCFDFKYITEKIILAEISGFRLLKVISGVQYLKLAFSDQIVCLLNNIDALGVDDFFH